MPKLKAVIQCKSQTMCSAEVPDWSTVVQGQQGSNANRDTWESPCPTWVSLAHLGSWTHKPPSCWTHKLLCLAVCRWCGCLGICRAPRLFWGRRPLQSGYSGLPRGYGQCPNTQKHHAEPGGSWLQLLKTWVPKLHSSTLTVEWRGLKNPRLLRQHKSIKYTLWHKFMNHKR